MFTKLSRLFKRSRIPTGRLLEPIPLTTSAAIKIYLEQQPYSPGSPAQIDYVLACELLELRRELYRLRQGCHNE